MLFDMKAEGRLRYVGITTSEGRRHDVFEKIMRTAPLDFVQFTYNIVDREAEDRLLPLAADSGMAVIVDRPFAGMLTRRLEGEPLPAWAAEIGASSWAQFILKFILAPCRHCRHPRHDQRRSCAREYGSVFWRISCRRHAEADGGLCPQSLMSAWWTYDRETSCSSPLASTGACSNCTTLRCGPCMS